MRPVRMPQVPNDTDVVVLSGGVDLISPPGHSAPGTLRFAINYEQEFGGGYRRVGGFERFDGRSQPHLASYVVLGAVSEFDITVGATVEGSVSGAEGKVIWVSQDATRIALTRLLEGVVFEEGEDILLADTPRGTIADASPTIDPFLDNDLAYLAAEEYRPSIQKPAGSGPVLGLATLGNSVFAWRNNADASALVIHRATPSGWVPVALNYRVSFEAGTALYTDDSTLTQGGVSATILRVVVTEGEWGAAAPEDQARGYFIISAPLGGDFVAGVATGLGGCTLTGPQTAIVLAPLTSGKLSIVSHNFFGSFSSRRLYGCDGANKEFEFDGTVYVPLETGMPQTVKAQHAAVHKNHLFFSYGSSLQFSGVADPYKWTPLFGAGEIATGDIITNFIAVAGSETSDALMVTCRDSVFVLYGSSAQDWDLKKISDEAGAQAYSGQTMLGPIAFDRDGFVRYRPTDVFGNFLFESASRQIDPLVRNSIVSCSVLAKNRGIYRCFFADGMVISATPLRKGVAWMPLDYGRTINVVWGGEVGGQYRVFMGDMEGWVLEADVGRSFDGEEVDAGLRLSSLYQRGLVLLKQYRWIELMSQAGSAFELAVGAELSDSDPDQAAVTQAQMTDFKKQYGVGLFWDFSSWDRSYWDGGAQNQVRYDVGGNGRSLGLLVRSLSDREMPHALQTLHVIYTTRRLAR